MNNLTELILCPVCCGSKFKVLRPSAYPKGLDEVQSLTLYSASSDHKLFDQLVECSNCSLVYLNPRIKQNLILDSYRSAIDPIFIKQNNHRIKTFENNLRWSTKYLQKALNHAKVLDIGCAGGAFPKAANNLGFDVIGVEPSVWMSDYARKTYGLDIRTGTLTDCFFESGSFDVVTMWDVIEHLTDPSAVLQEVKRIIKDDGIFIINFPDYSSYARKFLKFKWPFFLSVHLIYFTPETIKNILLENGFEISVSKPYWQTLQLGYVLKRAGAYFGVFNLLETVVNKIGIAGLPLKYNMGQTLMIVKKVKKA